MKSMIDSSSGIKDMISQIMGEQMRRVAGQYVRSREQKRAEALSQAQVVCWNNDTLLLSSKTQFPVKRLTLDSRVFVSQIHFWETPRPVDYEEQLQLSKQGVKDLNGIVSIGSAFVFYELNGKEECLTGNIHCRRWKNWESVKSDDIIVLYVAPDFPIGEVDNLESQFRDYLQMNAFLNSPYAFAEPRAPRRRKGKRAGRRRPETVKVVVLRKTPKLPDKDLTLSQQMAAQFYSEMTEQDEDKRQWKLSVRFKVVGHWRNQWYPSEKTHKRIWISDYQKGPDGAPMKVSVTVIKAIR